MNSLRKLFIVKKITNLNHQRSSHLNLGQAGFATEINFNRNPYRNIIPWENNVELSEHLIKTLVYHDNELLVLNKPYGITFSRGGNSAQIAQKKLEKPERKGFQNIKNKQSKEYSDSQYYSSGMVNDSLSLVDCLPYIKKYFGYNKLFISRVPGKYVSGVAILTTNPDLVNKINDIHVKPPTGKDRYLAVVVGVPRHSSGVVKHALQLEENSKYGKKVTLLSKWSENARKRGLVRVGTFHYQTHCNGFNHLTSLIEVRVNLRKYNALRVFATDHLLTPVLGDNLLGSRVQTVLDVPTAVNPFSEAALKPQILPEEVYSLLDIDPVNGGIIPIHVHLAAMELPKLFNGQTLLIKAPPPPYFEWTCKKLGLSCEEEAIAAV